MGNTRWNWLLCVGCVLSLMTGCHKRDAYSQSNAKSKKNADINARFLKKNLNVRSWKQRFERHSREVWRYRKEIVAALKLKPGQAVADVGSGTGAFLPPLLHHVGPKGRLYAVEISSAFVKYLKGLAAKKKWSQVQVVHSTETSTRLPAGSVDVVFTCDTYHHFDKYAEMLADIRRALRPGGIFVVVDFQRIPGVTAAWILGHVKLGKEAVIRQVQQHGFALQREVPLTQLKENYVLVFQVKPVSATQAKPAPLRKTGSQTPSK